MLKTILVGIVSVTSIICGVKIRGYYKKRADIWGELYKFALFFKEEITFNKTLLEDIFQKFDLSHELKQIKDGNYENIPIDESDAIWIKEFFSSLGRLSVTLELENIDRNINKIKEKSDKAHKVLQDKGGVSIKLGALVGLGVFVLLI